jgi:hypothetical protein
VVDEEEGQLEPEGLHLIPLPWMDDIRAPGEALRGCVFFFCVAFGRMGEGLWAQA